MHHRIITLLLLVGLLLGGSVLLSGAGSYRLPGNQQGYSPDQPIAFSHRLHAGELQINCKFCHSNAEVSRHSGIPAADVCMRCHKQLTAPRGEQQAEDTLADTEKRPAKRIVSPELRKLYNSLGLGEDLKPDPNKQPHSIAWVRIHNLPDYVYFDHRAHIGAGVKCQHCHGAVESMERMRQESTLGMGWCVDCHRDTKANGVHGKQVNPSLDCGTCHY